MSQETIIHWYRQDLRLSDLPALAAAADIGARVLAVYVLDDDAAGPWAPGGASRWWLHRSLERLAASIESQGGKLLLRRGDSGTVLRKLCREHEVTRIHCTRRYEPWAAQQEVDLHKSLQEVGIDLKRYPGTLLHEPGTVLTQAGEPFKVFTPFWRACRRVAVAPPLERSASKWLSEGQSDVLDDWELEPRNPDWAEGWQDQWQPGEDGASAQLDDFLDGPVTEYAEGRDFPADSYTSRLSPHLHHGEISPRQVWARSEARKVSASGLENDLNKFQAELGWREFSYHLLHFFPHIPEKPFKENFGAFPWANSKTHLEAWQAGRTGYPIVDAGMRELWQTGYMHNRVRMVVASFLCKHLLQHWRHGEDWFWDTLVDADLASNGCSWQWVAGSGADASPYFRIFNPVTQGEKFDKAGDYVRRWVPEIAGLPDKYLHKPWEAPDELLTEAGVELGASYPEPIVDHREARQSALDAYAEIKGK